MCKTPLFPSGYSCSLLFFWLHASGHPGIHQTCAIHFLFAVSYLVNHAFYMASGLPGTHQTCAKHPFFLLAIHALSYFFGYMRLDIRAFTRHVLPTVYPNQTWVYLLCYQRASEASELSPCSCQLRFQIYVYMRRTYVDLYAHAQEIIAKKRP